MEIVRFEPDAERIARRRDMRPFGDTSRIKVVKSTEAPRFVPYTTEVEIEAEDEKPYAAYRPVFELVAKTNAYVPPEIKRAETCSVKLSNLPLDITRDKLYAILKTHTKLFFANLNLVMNRETGVFRGFAFVVLESREEAVQFIRDLRGVAIDSLGLAAELARP